jgi:hypothetical protein
MKAKVLTLAAMGMLFLFGCNPAVRSIQNIKTETHRIKSRLLSIVHEEMEGPEKTGQVTVSLRHKPNWGKILWEIETEESHTSIWLEYTIEDAYCLGSTDEKVEIKIAKKVIDRKGKTHTNTGEYLKVCENPVYVQKGHQAHQFIYNALVVVNSMAELAEMEENNTGDKEVRISGTPLQANIYGLLIQLDKILTK